MTTDTPDLSPDDGELLQEEEHAVPLTPIPVVVEGPARVQQLPTRAAGMRTLGLDLTAVRVLEEDPRRRRALLQVSGDKVRIGPTQAAAAAGAVLADGSSIELTTCGEVWARADTTTCDLSVINEQWAT